MDRGIPKAWTLLLGAVVTLGVSACSSPEVGIKSATVSQDDTRVELSLLSCNAELLVDVVETDEQAVVTVSDGAAPLFDMGGGDCLDLHVLQLDSPLGERDLLDGTTGSTVSVLRPPPHSGAPFPYDRDWVTETEYLDALDAMVACLQATDPELDAWVYQALDWKTFRWDKVPDERGNTIRPLALDICHDEHLKALEPPNTSRWSDEDVSSATAIWLNELGLNQDDPDVWRDRLHEICAIGASQVTTEMAEFAFMYVEEDAEVSVRADGTLPFAEEAIAPLWTIARSPICNSDADPLPPLPAEGHEPWDKSAVMMPDQIVAEPAVVAPGASVEVLFPDERIRGIHFVLESTNSDGSSNLAYHLISDWGGTHEPRSYTVDEMEGMGVEDIGIGGPGPDIVIIPADVNAGSYRLCTANSRPNICTPLAIELYE